MNDFPSWDPEGKSRWSDPSFVAAVRRENDEYALPSTKTNNASAPKLIEKYFKGHYYVKIDGELSAGFYNEEHADIFIKALKDNK